MSLNLTYWLRKTPRPTAVLADDQHIDVPKNGRAWRDLTATIQALEPTKLTCLNEKGEVIRSVVLQADEEKPASVSQEFSDLQFFGKLLAEGYKDGRAANQPLVDSAMQFVERQSQRLAKAESEIDRLRNVIHKLQGQLTEATSAPVPEAADDSIVGTMIAGALQAQAQKSALSAVKTNGGKKP